MTKRKEYRNRMSVTIDFLQLWKRQKISYDETTCIKLDFKNCLDQCNISLKCFLSYYFIFITYYFTFRSNSKLACFVYRRHKYY